MLPSRDMEALRMTGIDPAGTNDDTAIGLGLVVLGRVCERANEMRAPWSPL